MAVVVALAERVHNDLAAAGRGVDEIASADVDAAVAYVAIAAAVEADDVAGLELAAVDVDAVAEQGGGGAVGLVAVLLVDVVDEAGAVEAAGRGARPDVWDAEIFLRCGDYGAAAGGVVGGLRLGQNLICEREVVAVDVAGVAAV